MPIYFRGRHRLAALHIIDRTPLGDSLARVGGMVDDGELLSIDVTQEDRASLSNGERALLKFLASLSGQDAINLWSLMQDVDEACATAAVEALSLAIGQPLHAAVA